MRQATCVLCLLLPPFCPNFGRGAEPRIGSKDSEIRKMGDHLIEMVRRQDWDKYAGLIHSDSLREFKDSFVPGLKAILKEGQKKQTSILLLFDGAKDIPSLIEMDPKEFLARYLRARAARSFRLKDELQSMDVKMIGIVHEEINLVHIVARQHKKTAGAARSKVIIISLKRSGKEWKVLQTPEKPSLLGEFRLGFGD